MISVLGHHYGTTSEDALQHYLGRLQDLGDYAEALGGLGKPGLPAEIEEKTHQPLEAEGPRPSGRWLTYDALVSRTDVALEALGSFLDLHGLAPTYRVRSFTGRRGDPSPSIRAGRILSGDVRPPHDVRLDPDMLRQADAAYRRTIDLLRVTLPGVGDPSTHPDEPALPGA
jgi:hypothetical protein